MCMSREPRKGKLGFKGIGQLDEVFKNKSSDGLIILPALCHFQVVYQVFPHSKTGVLVSR